MTEPTPIKRRPGGLGRGLNALLGEMAREEQVGGGAREASPGVRMLPVSALAPSGVVPPGVVPPPSNDELPAEVGVSRRRSSAVLASAVPLQ